MAITNPNIPLPAMQSPPVDLSTPLDPTTLRDLTILITGGASGLGAAMARSWAQHGAHLIIGDLNHQLGKSLIGDLRTSTGNPNHHFLPLDVTSWTSQLEFFEEAVRLSPHGGIDCVVANAGICLAEESGAFEKPRDYHALLKKGRGQSTPPPPQFKTLDVNLTGVLYTAHLALAYLPLNPGSSPCSISISTSPSTPNPTPHRDRHILLLSSLAGLTPLPTQPLYSLSKHAVTGLFRTLRTTAPLHHGVRVNMLCPYFTKTPILGVVGNAVLAGAGVCTMDGVVEAATRLVEDRGVVGRGLGVGPGMGGEGEGEGQGPGSFRFKGGEVEIGATTTIEEEDDPIPTPATISAGTQSGIWDVYAHDFEQSDLFARRILGITNLVAARKGRAGVATDLGQLVGESMLGKLTVLMLGGIVAAVVYGWFTKRFG